MTLPLPPDVQTEISNFLSRMRDVTIAIGLLNVIVAVGEALAVTPPDIKGCPVRIDVADTFRAYVSGSFGGTIDGHVLGPVEFLVTKGDVTIATVCDGAPSFPLGHAPLVEFMQTCNLILTPPKGTA